MSTPQPANNDPLNSDRSVEQLAWAIAASTGQFKLILARCNYASWRDRLISRLREISSVEIFVLVVQQSNRTLYTAIRESFGEQIPGCVMVVGLETVQNLAVMLTSTNQVREEFRKHFSFPLVIWIDDQIYKQLMDVAPDLESWAITRNFPISQQQLTDFINQTAHQLFSNSLKLSANACIKLEHELETAKRDLLSYTAEFSTEENLSPNLSPTRGEALNSPPSLAGKGVGGLGQQLIPDAEFSTEENLSPNLSPTRGEALNSPPSLAGKGVGGLGQQLIPDAEFSTEENLSPNLSPTRGEALNSPPSLVGKGVGGLGQQLIPDAEFSTEENLSPNLSPTRGEALNSPPSLAGKGVGGLGQQLIPHSASHNSPNASHLELTANLESLLGFAKQINNQPDAAIEHYRQAAALWQQSNALEKQGKIISEIAFCYYIKACQHQDDNSPDWQATRQYAQEYIQIITQLNHPDFLANSIFKIGDVLRNLKAWEPLKNLVEQAVTIHETNNQPRELAKDYFFLAEVALAQEKWQEANQLIQEALDIAFPALVRYTGKGTAMPCPYTSRSDEIIEKILSANELSLYRFILGRSQYHLGQITQAIITVEAAKFAGNPVEDVKLYVDILNFLHQLYWENKDYLKAYKTKQHRRSIEQQFGLRAFVGAGRLESIKQSFSENLSVTSAQDNIAPEIAASGRLLDVERLIERIGRPDYKLIVIYGQSGVGKSSLVNAGLVPALKQKAIGVQDNLPVVMRVYTNWVEELARLLSGGREGDGGDGGDGEVGRWGDGGEVEVSGSEYGTWQYLISRFKKNEERNQRTVLIFDQFEEFFFVYTEPAQRKQFFEFLGDCLNVLSLKVILSLRVDYIHYLLECNDLPSLQIIGNDILCNHVLYKLGNFSREDAKSIIQRLIERTTFQLEPDLVDELVNDLAKDLGEVRPIELQVVGAQLQTEKITTLAEYRRRGTKKDLVQRYLEEVVKDCGVEHQSIAEFLLYLLTDEKGTRPLKTRAELERDLELFVITKDKNQNSPSPHLPTSPSNLDLVLEIFVQSGLVVLLPENPADRYQLVHDYIAAFIREQKSPQLKQVMAELEKEREQRKQSEAKLNRVLKRALFGTITAGLGFAALAMVTLQWAIEANVNQISAIDHASEAYFVTGQYRDALLSALRAGNKLKQTIWAKYRSDIEMQTVLTLRQAVYLKPNENKENRAIEVNTLESHSNAVMSVAYSPDGKQLASDNGDNTIKIWDISTGQAVKTLSGHSSQVNSVAYSPDGKHLASASYDGSIKIWDITTAKAVKTLSSHSREVYSVAYSPDGKHLASASYDGSIKIWDITTGQAVKTLSGHSSQVWRVAYSPDGKHLASASEDNTIKIWDISTGEAVKTLSGHSDAVNSVAYSPDGQHLASASEDNTIKIWDISTGEAVKTLSGHSNKVNSVAYSHDGKQLASASRDYNIKIWDISTAKAVKTLSGHRSSVYSVAYSPDGKQLASASHDLSIKIWDISTAKAVTTLSGHSSGVNSVAYSPDGKQLASASFDNTIKIWDISTAKAMTTLSSHSNSVYRLAYSPDGKQLASASFDNTIKIWDISTAKAVTTLSGHSDTVRSVAYSLDGKHLASASDDSTIKIWDISTAKAVTTLSGHSSGVNSVAYSPDGKHLASASSDLSIKIWDISTAKAVTTLSGHRDALWSVAYSPDGKKLASASFDNTIKIWDISTAKAVKTLSGHSSAVYSVAYSPDGKQLASASFDNTIKIWNISTGKAVKTLSGHSREVYSVAYSPDGKQLASASADTKIILWDLDFDNLLRSGCDLLSNYLIAHPEVLKELQSCQTPGR